MNYNGKKILKLLGIVGGVILGIYLVFRVSFYLAPFIIALIISAIIEPLIRLLVRKLKLPRKAAAAVSLLLTLSVIGLLITLLITKVIKEMVGIQQYLVNFYNTNETEIGNYVDTLVQKANDIYQWLPKEVSGQLESLVSSLTSSLKDIIAPVVKGTINFAISLPEILIFILATIISCYFMSSDRVRITEFFKTHLPEAWIEKAVSLKTDLFSALFGYVRAQLILMSITFCELYTGFLILGVEYKLILAIVISIIDALPIVGTGGILIPWALYSLLFGSVKTGVSLLILYGVVLVVRQMIEPKVLGQQIGVHPLMTLMAMYVGLKLLGFFGLILGPITVLILKNVFSGIFKQKTFKELLGD